MLGRRKELSVENDTTTAESELSLPCWKKKDWQIK
jgi:hypothetical protein